MERMSGLDASFLYFETASHLMHIGVVAVVDPREVPGGYDYTELRSALLGRLEAIPALRRKVRHVPLDLAHPLWVDDADFDIDQHLHRTSLPAPGGMDEVAELCGDLHSTQLDRTRPLWEMWVLEGMADGRVALFLKLHHSMVDGVGGASVIAQLGGLAPTRPTARGAELVPVDQASTGDLELAARGLLTLLLKPVGVARMVVPTVAGLSRTLGRAVRGTTMAAPFRAPRTRFNAAVSGRRSLAFADLALEDMREVKRLTGATVNDVLLAVCGGALRTYLLERGELPDATLVANVPVSVHAISARARGSNKVTTLFARLGTDRADPLDRLAVISAGTRTAKAHAEDLGADTLQDWAEVGSGRVVARVLQAYSDLRLADRHPVIHNLVISNIPGPAERLQLLGYRLDAVYPLGPVMDGAGLNVTVMSQAGTLHVGVGACRDLMPDLRALAALLGPELDALKAAAQRAHEGELVAG